MDVVSMQQRALSFLSSSASSSAVSRCLHIPPRFCVGVWVSVCSIYKYIAAADAAVLMTGIKYLQRSLKGPFSRAVSLSLSFSLAHSLQRVSPAVLQHLSRGGERVFRPLQGKKGTRHDLRRLGTHDNGR